MLHGLVVQSSASLSVTLASYLMLDALVLADPNNPKQKGVRKIRVNRKKMGGDGQIEMLTQLRGVSL